MEMLRVSPDHPEVSVIARAAACLKAGGLVAFPTETVYGLGAHALDPDAVQRVFDAKGRPRTDPLIVHVATWDQVLTLTSFVPESAERVADIFWPGPLTLVLSRSPTVPILVTAGLDTVAIRMPSHPVARALLQAVRIPIAAPSANLFSRPSPTLASHVRDDLGDRVDLILDGGPTQVGLESTVLDVSKTPATVLRPGAITVEALRTLLPDLRPAMAALDGPSPQAALPSPGLLSRHYSPRAPLTLYVGQNDAVASTLVAAAIRASRSGARVGVLLASEDLPLVEADAGQRLVVFDAGSLGNLQAVAKRLYVGLRTLDDADIEVIFAREFPGDEGLAIAIRDRLRRAAAGRIVRC